jgi:hypothetical protein
LDGIFEAEQRSKKENCLHRRNKGLGKLRFRPFPHRHICAAYFFRVAVFIVSQSPLRSSMEFVSLHRSIRFQYMRNSRSVGISFSHTFFDRVNLALRHCEGTANGSALGFDPSAWGIRFSSCILVYAKEISQPRKSTAVSDATQRLLQPFPNLFSFQLMSSL